MAGQPEKCGQAIEQAQQVAPNHQAVLHARFLWLVSQERFEELKGISSAYLCAQEPDPAPLLNAASILMARDTLELKREGCKLYEQAATLAPTSIDAQLGLASALYQTGEAERAEQLYRQFLEKRPNEVHALNDLAWILQEHFHRYDAALELANKALKLTSSDQKDLLRSLLDTRATILMNLPDRLAEARNDYVQLVDLWPDKTAGKARILLRLGRLCVQLNDPVQAGQHFRNALEIDREINVFTPAERTEISTEISRLAQRSGR